MACISRKIGWSRASRRAPFTRRACALRPLLIGFNAPGRSLDPIIILQRSAAVSTVCGWSLPPDWLAARCVCTFPLLQACPQPDSQVYLKPRFAYDACAASRCPCASARVCALLLHHGRSSFASCSCLAMASSQSFCVVCLFLVGLEWERFRPIELCVTADRRRFFFCGMDLFLLFAPPGGTVRQSGVVLRFHQWNLPEKYSGTFRGLVGVLWRET